MKKTLIALSTIIVLNACSSIPSKNSLVSNNTQTLISMPKNELKTYPAPKDLDFANVQGEKKSFTINGQVVNYRAFENIVYVLKPTDTRYQAMNIYIPEAYYNDNSIDGFNAETAPIFFPNNVGGYMPATAGKPELEPRSNNTPNAIMVALSKGYVVASAGARGRTEANGRAPAGLVDLKAAVRYLKANDKTMVGDANKIISNGTSAGGAMSVLLGTTGNAPEFQPYLQALGSANSTDDIFAVSAYCPITNLENADAAYEWQFNGVNDYQKIDISNIDYHVERKIIKGTQTTEQIALSSKLKPLFSHYVNSLKLKNTHGTLMTLDKNGNGTFKKQVEAILIQSAQQALNTGTDLSEQTWLTVQNGKVTNANFDVYAKFVGRQKITPAFDGVDLSTGENQLFGTATIDKQHFTDFSMKQNTVQGATSADDKIVHMMNPMNYAENAPTQYYRIRHGENDRDTSIAIPTLLALKLSNSGKTVDFALPWGRPHSGDYDLDELFAWAKKITTEK